MHEASGGLFFANDDMAVGLDRQKGLPAHAAGDIAKEGSCFGNAIKAKPEGNLSFAREAQPMLGMCCGGQRINREFRSERVCHDDICGASCGIIL